MTSVTVVRNSRCRPFGVKPATVTSPDVGCSRPESIFKVVVLPAPLGPRKPTISPGAISNEMSSTAFTALYSRWNSARRLPTKPACFSCTS